MASYDKAIATAASLAASVMLVRSIANELLPHEVRDMLSSGLSNLATRINTDINMQRLRVSSMDQSEKMVISMEAGEEMVDMYEGAEFKWCLVSREVPSDSSNNNNSQREIRSYEVSFHKKHKEKALKEYLPFIVATAKAIKDEERALNIYMNEYSDSWSPIVLQHPSTFDTLAMEQKQKQSIIDDLNRFIKRKDYYKRIGKAWKRGYLLYGPPGTGKSSLIAAIANHLRFDIYDLELTGVDCNSDLKRLLVGMTNRSILVVEDIDLLMGCGRQVGRKGSSSSRPITRSVSTQHFCGLAGWTCTSTWGTATQRLSEFLPTTTIPSTIMSSIQRSRS